jgi:hypothetical protein
LLVKTMTRRRSWSGAGDRAFLRVWPAKSGSVGKSENTQKKLKCLPWKLILVKPRPDHDSRRVIVFTRKITHQKLMPYW